MTRRDFVAATLAAYTGPIPHALITADLAEHINDANWPNANKPVSTGSRGCWRPRGQGKQNIISARRDRQRAAPATAIAPVVPQATYVAAYNYRAEWPHHKKLFAVIDTQAASREMAEPNAVAPFFSRNIQSLGNAQRSAAQTRALSFTKPSEP